MYMGLSEISVSRKIDGLSHVFLIQLIQNGNLGVTPIFRDTHTYIYIISLWIQVLAEKGLNPPNHAPNTPSEGTWIYRVYIYNAHLCLCVLIPGSWS